MTMTEVPEPQPQPEVNEETRQEEKQEPQQEPQTQPQPQPQPESNQEPKKELKEQNGGFDIWEETKALLNIALPAVAVQFSLVIIFPETTSMVGTKIGTDALAGNSLGSLVGNLTVMSVIIGALTAADTLMPRAYGSGDYAEIGRLAIRSFVMCCILLIFPLIPMLTAMEWIFDMLGQDETVAHLAAQWVKLFLIGVPATLLYRVIQSFLNSQNKVWPLVYSSAASAFLVHPFILRWFVSRLGFRGSSMAIAATTWIMVIFLLLYLKIFTVYKPESWPGLSKKYFMEAISPKPMLKFLSLSLGGVLSLSEWWFRETVCFIVGTFGVVPLCVHTIAINLVLLVFMIPLGILIGLTVRMGQVIAFDVAKAKLLAAWSMLFTTILGAVVSLLLYVFRRRIVYLFSSDPDVMDGCMDIWVRLCIYVFLLHIYSINVAILRALGMQWTIAAVIILCLWLTALPVILIFAVHKERGLDTIWNILPIVYTVAQVLLVAAYSRVDWDSVGMSVRRSAHKEETPTQKTEIESSKTARLLEEPMEEV